MCAGEWNGCCIPRPCPTDPCGRKPFPVPCPDPPATCPPDPCGCQIPPVCAPDGPPPFGPPGCRPGPEICISRPCDEKCCPGPCREEYFASFREFQIARLIEALNRMISGCR